MTEKTGTGKLYKSTLFLVRITSLTGALCNAFGIYRMIHRRAQLGLDFLVGRVESQRQSVARLKQARSDRHRIAAHIAKQQRFVRLRHQGGDIAQDPLL